MHLHAVNIAIILAYFLTVILIGLWVSRRGAKDLDSYFLGSKSLPWYLLGISDASGMFDISGTMWMVYILFVYGLKSIWLPFLWPVFNQIFLMMFLSGWLRRSNVLTGAEWIQTRFGRDTGASLAHLSVVFFALVNVIGMLAYAFKGIGKFAVVMLPWRFNGYGYFCGMMDRHHQRHVRARADGEARWPRHQPALYLSGDLQPIGGGLPPWHTFDQAGG